MNVHWKETTESLHVFTESVWLTQSSELSQVQTFIKFCSCREHISHLATSLYCREKFEFRFNNNDYSPQPLYPALTCFVLRFAHTKIGRPSQNCSPATPDTKLYRYIDIFQNHCDTIIRSERFRTPFHRLRAFHYTVSLIIEFRCVAKLTGCDERREMCFRSFPERYVLRRVIVLSLICFARFVAWCWWPPGISHVCKITWQRYREHNAR